MREAAGRRVDACSSSGAIVWGGLGRSVAFIQREQRPLGRDVATGAAALTGGATMRRGLMFESKETAGSELTEKAEPLQETARARCASLSLGAGRDSARPR